MDELLIDVQANSVIRRTVRLPHDVIFLILSEAVDISMSFDIQKYLNGQDEWKEVQRDHGDKMRSSTVDLNLLSLVSKDWNEVVTPLLYRNLRLKDQHHISLLAATLESLYGTPLPWIGIPCGGFVKSLDIGDPSGSESTSETLTNIQRIIIHCPNLRSFSSSRKNSLSVQSYSVRVVKPLMKYARNLTTLHILETDFIVGDLNRLVNQLPQLETLFIGSTLRWQLQEDRSRVSSLSIRTLIISSYYEHSFNCANEDKLNIAAGWTLPNLRMVVVHDRCGTLWLMGHISPFLSKHQASLQTIVLRRWGTNFTEEDEFLLVAQFPQFKNVIKEPTSIRFSKN